MIERRLTSERLVPLHRGVYAVGHSRLRSEGYWLAAVLAVPGAVLSHRDAAGLHGLRPVNHARIDITTATCARNHAGIAVHRTRVLDPHDVATVQGIPATSVARTLVDLAGLVPWDQLAKAMRQADQMQVLDVDALHDALARTRGRRGPGHGSAREALAELETMATTLTRSSLEVAFQRIVKRAGLDQPRTNVRIDGTEVDAYWPRAKLVVELDGWAFHRSRHAFQRDRERDATLTAAGYRVVRFTHRQVVDRSAHVAETLRSLLAR